MYDEKFYCKDVIHGYIELSPISRIIIDTEPFQRLRLIKQTGIADYVYPTSNHTRFEHSLGTAYLTKKLLTTLQRTNNGYMINEKDILLAEVAGLLHDVGHGPFSHMFEVVVAQKKKVFVHEEMSCRILDYLVDTVPELKKCMEYHNFNMAKDIATIKAMIYPSKYLTEAVLNCMTTEYFESNETNHYRLYIKHFMFEVVSNQLTSIDCDKIDYICRDSFSVGLKFSFDIDRFFKNCIIRPNNNKALKKFYQNAAVEYPILSISVRDKELLSLHELVYARWRLHRTVYQHKTVKNVEFFFVKIISMLWEILDVDKCLADTKRFAQLNDYTFFSTLTAFYKPFKVGLQCSKNNDGLLNLRLAKNLLKRVNRRKLLKFCGQISLNVNKSALNFTKDVEKFKESIDHSKQLCRQDMHVSVTDLSLKGFARAGCETSGVIDQPLNNVPFHTKSFSPVNLRPAHISSLLPGSFSETLLFVFFGPLGEEVGEADYDNSDQYHLAVKLFQNWCAENNLPLTTVDVNNEETGMFTQEEQSE